MPLLTRAPLGAAALAALTLGLAATPAAAACGPDANQMELNECAGEALSAADATLNERYQAVIGRLSDDADKTELLRKAQRAWIAFRDAECTFAASGVAGGSIYPLVDAECRTALTKARAETLDGFLHCEEGDTTCPVPPQ
ncbi:MAG: hypothetical protein AcusKO_16280 [Acuticoccus sp.]